MSKQKFFLFFNIYKLFITEKKYIFAEINDNKMEDLKEIKEIANIEALCILSKIDLEKHDMKSFFRWLKMHGIYSYYMEEIMRKNHSKEKSFNIITNLVNCREMYDIIDSTLYWVHTNQGHHFWEFYNRLYTFHCSQASYLSKKLLDYSTIVKRIENFL